MARGIRDEELARRGRVAFKVKEHAIDTGFGMGVFAFGNGISKGGVAVDEIEGVVGQFAEVVADGFVGTMNRGVERGVLDVYPIGFIVTRLNYSVLREGERVRVCGDW